jgi:hypothetical protein
MGSGRGWCRAVRIGGQRTIEWGSTHRGAARWGSAVSGRSSGWESIVAAPRAARGRVALVGGLAGIATNVAENARVLGAILDSPYPDTILGGTTHPRCPPWWHLASALRVVVAPRIRAARRGGTTHPHLARIGVGAVQNRRRYHRVISTVCGDAGRPAHQRTETPRCARHHHDRFPPVCGPTDRRFAPRRPPTPRNHALRAAPPRSFRTRLRPHGAPIRTPIIRDAPRRMCPHDASMRGSRGLGGVHPHGL